MNTWKSVAPYLAALAACLHLAACGGSAPGAGLQEGPQTDSAAEDRLSAGTTYTLVNDKANTAAQVKDAHNGEVVTATLNDDPRQQWTAQDAGGGQFFLLNRATQKALGLAVDSKNPGIPVVQATPNQGATQKWRVQQLRDGVQQLVNVSSGACLDVSFGSVGLGRFLQQWTCADSSEMTWRMTAPGAAKAPRQAVPKPAPAAADDAPAVAAKDGYTPAQLQQDIAASLVSRGPIYSNRNLGNPINVQLWTPEKVQSLHRGIVTAQQFFPRLALRDLARLVVAEGAQESTGNYALPGYSVGFLQVTPATVVLDFKNHGTPVLAPDGSAVVSPDSAPDLLDPGQNVALWAWYTHNAVVAGISLNEVALGHKQGGVTRDFGNAQFNWLAGPHNDRHRAELAQSYKDYHDRILDYFVQSKFGDAARFEQLIATPIGDTLLNVK